MTTARPHQHLYGRRWRRERAAFLERNPLCCYCDREHRIRPATVVDHKRPHRGVIDLFWDEANWQALCFACHDGRKREEEGRTRRVSVGVDGQPKDANDAWHMPPPKDRP